MRPSQFVAISKTLLLVCLFSLGCFGQGIGTVFEFPILYPAHPPVMGCSMHHGSATGSTHEITFNEKGGKDIWITGQNEDKVVRVTLDGKMMFYDMPLGSGPHGIEFDADGRVWVTLEFAGKIVRLDQNGRIDKAYDVRLACATCPAPLDSHPHGMGFAPDKRTIWYTGKATGTVGKITPDGKIQTFQLPTVGSVPIYVKAGPDKNMWVTELVGNVIARVTQAGKVDEFCIPTHNSRPIAIVPGPDGNMWFSEEAGNKVARIDMQGNITEYPVPMKQPNMILAGLSFDNQKNLWVQQYVDQNNPVPAGTDYIIKIDKAILTTAPSNLPSSAFTFYPVPTKETVFHRIIQGPDGNMWFTEMKADKVGKLITGANAF
jgi:virginiamycin B lyase